MLAIKNNLMAGNAARHLGTSYDALSKSVERLSSGLRINSAKDDAAGMAVRELVRADIAQIQQGSRNAQDAISMAQTAEGATDVIDQLLVRMKTLAEQAATDSYSTEQRQIMDDEFQQLAQEITRVAQDTKFNNIALLNPTGNVGHGATFNIHIASDTTIDITAEDLTATGLGLGTTGAKATATLNLGSSNPNQAGFVTGAAGDGTLTVSFADEAPANDFTVTFDEGTEYSMNQVVQMINDAASYTAASVEYDDSTNQYFIVISAENAGQQVPTIGGTQSLTATNYNGSDSAGAVTIDSIANATNALDTLTQAIKDKDTYRASLGYMMNRLQSAVSVLDIQAENLQSAESRISDVDVATEMAAMTRNQVLANAGISMLGQANQMPQMALQLLRG